MKKQILIILIVIALLLLAIMRTTSLDTNEGGKVWSDGYVEVTLNKMERTDTPPEIFRQYHSPKDKQDFVVINLTLAHIEGRHVLMHGKGNSGGEIPKSFLFDSKGDKYTGLITMTKIELRWNISKIDSEIEYSEAFEGSELL